MQRRKSRVVQERETAIWRVYREARKANLGKHAQKIGDVIKLVIGGISKDPWLVGKSRRANRFFFLRMLFLIVSCVCG